MKTKTLKGEKTNKKKVFNQRIKCTIQDQHARDYKIASNKYKDKYWAKQLSLGKNPVFIVQVIVREHTGKIIQEQSINLSKIIQDLQ